MSTAPALARTRRDHLAQAAGGGATARASRPAGREETSAQPSSRPELYVVRSAAPSRARVPFALIVVLIVAAALVASMVLNASMASTAFSMQKAQVELNVLNDHIDTVRSQVERASAADELARRATELGMVPAGAPGVVDLTHSTTSGGQAAQAE